MALQPHGPAPYTTSTAAIVILDAFRDRGLGAPLSTDVVIRAGVQESLGRRTFHSLKLLELIGEDGQPTQQWEDLRLTRGQDEYQTRVQEWLRDVYADVLQYADPSTDTQERVAEAFRSYEPSGQRRAMALLLIGLWRYAGLPVAEATSERPSTPKPRPQTRPRAADKPTKAKGVVFYGGGSVGGELPPGLVGLLQQIPRGGKGWTQETRDNFLTAFTAVLDFTVPIRPIGLEDLTDENMGVNSS